MELRPFVCPHSYGAIYPLFLSLSRRLSLSLSLFAISEATNNPTASPTISPNVALLIKRPTTSPTTMAVTIAISRLRFILLKCFLLIQCNNISQQPVSSRHSGRQLPEKDQACINKFPFSITGYHQAAFLLGFSRIFHGQYSLISRIGLPGKIDPSLLYPSFEIFIRDLIREIQHRMLRLQEVHVGIFIRHPVIGHGKRVWPDIAFHLSQVVPVVLN